MSETLPSNLDGTLFQPLSAYKNIRLAASTAPTTASPSLAAIQTATSSIVHSLPSTGKGDASTLQHILSSLVPGFNGSSLSSNYYGFVTGGVLPIAEAADNIVSAFDQNVQVHLPSHSICTAVDYAALHMLLQLVGFEDETGKPLSSRRMGGESQEDRWHGTFTTGATGANVLGLLCGREAILDERLRGLPGYELEAEKPSVAELGLLDACARAGVKQFQVLTTAGHSSLYKAAAIAGIGRACVKDVSVHGQPGILDWNLLEESLKEKTTACIMSVSAGDVNTGRFATSGYADMLKLSALCHQYKAWLHVDGAFGLFARALPSTPEFDKLREKCKGLELADSIAGDAHKSLNVPYDCGFFLTRHLNTLVAVCKNPNAPYLSASGPSSIPSPLNISLENSRRFRALPVYSVLVSHGAEGISDIFARQVRLARKVAAFIDSHSQYQLLPVPHEKEETRFGTTISGKVLKRDFSDIHIIVLFRAENAVTNEELVTRINASGTIYVSGTTWGVSKESAVRIAVSTWKVDVERDFEIIRTVLEDALRE